MAVEGWDPDEKSLLKMPMVEVGLDLTGLVKRFSLSLAAMGPGSSLLHGRAQRSFRR